MFGDLVRTSDFKENLGKEILQIGLKNSTK